MPPMNDLRQILVYFCLASVLALIIPLFLLDKFWYFAPYESAEVLKKALQSSALLEKAHLISLGSVIPLTVDLVWDLSSQSAEITAVAQIKERLTILLTLAAFSISFLCCRELSAIPAVYIGVNCMRANIVMTVMYYAVYPELSSKLDKIIDRGLFYVLLWWLVSNILTTYAVYFDSSSMGLVSIILQAFLIAFVVYWFSHWAKKVAVKQNDSFIQFDRLTTDEYATLSYVVPLIISPVMQLVYCFSFGDISWQRRSENGLVVHIAIIYALHMALILVPGRVLHMLVVTKINLLRLKQIFVRYVSHEIRSPLNVVHVGLEMLVSLIDSAATTSSAIIIDSSTADFIRQMFFSSESAINILNDLLQYEHIEAGTFSLSCNALSMVKFLENKFGWAHVMASQKGVVFSVKDSSLATEFGPSDVIPPTAYEENGLDGVYKAVLEAQRNLVVYVDIYRIEQVIRNLITNAMKFTPREGEVSVGISYQVFGSNNAIGDKFGKDAVGYLCVDVTDSGVGLSEEEQRNIFGEFTQFNKNELQRGGGSGLGLWISRHIVHMHKGFMGVTSAGRGHGSTFFFELPVYGPDYSPPQPQPFSQTQPPSQPQPQQQPQPLQLSLKPSSHVAEPRLLRRSSVASAAGSVDRSSSYLALSDVDIAPSSVVNSSLPGATEYDAGTPHEAGLDDESPLPLRILIVDDSSLNVKVVARLIESEKVGTFANATLLMADDGTTAVEQLRNEMSAGRAVHFVLMDFIMTTMDGPEAARMMREELNYRGVILGITGNALPDDIDLFVSSGANHVITKPLSRVKLMDALHRFVPVAMALATAGGEQDE